MRNIIRVALVGLMLLTACGQRSAPSHSYFDSLVVAQVSYLSSARASIVKHASIGGKNEQSTFTPDSTAWESELGIFRQLSAVESPAYRADYRVLDGLNDPNSNLTVRQFHSTTTAIVPDLRFYYFNKFEHLKKIEATYRQRNLLYSTTRILRMEFEELGGKPILTSYSVDGMQKMVFGDSVRFAIRSEIVN